MAITRGGTTSSFSTSVEGTTGDVSHTVDSGTDLLVLSVSMRANHAVNGTPQWSLGGGENLTLIHASTSSDLAGDQRQYIYGLISPTVGAGTIDVVIDPAAPWIFSSAINYIGCDTASVAAATNFLSEDVNDTNTQTSVHASAGSSGNALYFAGCLRGGDGDPSSNASSFTELFDGGTGADATQDGAFYVADLLDSAPAAITVTWAVSDENASIYVEIVAAAVGANPKGPLGLPLNGSLAGPI